MKELVPVLTPCRALAFVLYYFVVIFSSTTSTIDSRKVKGHHLALYMAQGVFWLGSVCCGWLMSEAALFVMKFEYNTDTFQCDCVGYVLNVLLYVVCSVACLFCARVCARFGRRPNPM
jgi:hypothetical protein